MINEEIDSDAELDKIDDNSGDENLYRQLIVNNVSKCYVGQYVVKSSKILFI